MWQALNDHFERKKIARSKNLGEWATSEKLESSSFWHREIYLYRERRPSLNILDFSNFKLDFELAIFQFGWQSRSSNEFSHCLNWYTSVCVELFFTMFLPIEMLIIIFVFLIFVQCTMFELAVCCCVDPFCELYMHNMLTDRWHNVFHSGYTFDLPCFVIIFAFHTTFILRQTFATTKTTKPGSSYEIRCVYSLICCCFRLVDGTFSIGGGGCVWKKIFHSF